MGREMLYSFAGNVPLDKPENEDEFERWLDKMIADSKKKLGMTNERLAYYLLREGLSCYHKYIWRKDA